MTQHMGMMDFSDNEEEGEDSVVGYLQLMPPHSKSLGWKTIEFKDGETSVGRNDNQDITIADSSVSGSHAAIDIIDLPTAGDKRVTLKDLRSTNGTYVVDAETGDKTRLAPKKAMVLPEEGCTIHFGAVVCKVVMGPAPSTSASDGEEGAETAAAYDADTQLPSAMLYEIDADDERTVGVSASGNKGGTEPLPPVPEEAKPAVKPSNNGATEERSYVKSEVTGGDVGDVVERKRDRSSGEVIDETQHENLGRQCAEMQRTDVDKGLNLPEAASAASAAAGGGTLAIDGRKEVGVMRAGREGAGGDMGTDLKLPTQAVAMEFEGSGDKAQEGVDEKTELGARQSSGASHQKAHTGVPVGAVVESAGLDVAGKEEGVEDEDDGDETADEGDTAQLFDNKEDDDMSDAIASAQEGVPSREPGAEQAHRGKSPGLNATPLTPSTAPEYITHARKMTSPGGVSDVSTERQESPSKSLNLDEGMKEQQGSTTTAEEAALDEAGTGNAGGFLKGGGVAGADKNGDIGVRSAEAAAANAEESDADDGSDSSGVLIPTHEDASVKQPESDDDQGSASSGALIPAQDLEGFEEDLVDTVPDEGHNPPAVAPPITDEERAAAGGHRDSTSVEGEAGDEPGSETDATEVDTDDEPTGNPPPGGGETAATGNASREGTGTGAVHGTSGSPAEIRSPGGSLLRRTTTEDAMEAIAREQQREEAREVALAVARVGAEDIAHALEDDQAEIGAEGCAGEAETQAMPMEDGIYSDSDADMEGTEIIEEAESPELGDDCGSGSMGEDLFSERSPVDAVTNSGKDESTDMGPEKHGTHESSASEVYDNACNEVPESGALKATSIEGIKDRAESGSENADDVVDRHQGGKDKGKGEDGEQKSEEEDDAADMPPPEVPSAKAKRGRQASMPAAPRVSGRRRVRPKAFDEIDDDAPATLEKALEKGKRKEKSTQPTAPQTPPSGRGRGARRTSFQEDEDVAAHLSTPAVTHTRRRHRGKDHSAPESDDDELREEQEKAQRTTRGGTRRSEVSSEATENSKPGNDTQLSPSKRRTTATRGRRSRDLAACSRSQDETEPEADYDLPVTPRATRGRGRGRKESQHSDPIELAPAGNQAEEERTAKAVAGRKRKAEVDDVVEMTDRSSGKERLEGKSEEQGGAIATSTRKAKRSRKRGPGLGEEDDPLAVQDDDSTPTSSRRGRKTEPKKGGAKADPAHGSLSRGRGRATTTGVEKASPPSPRASGRSRGRSQSMPASPIAATTPGLSASVEYADGENPGDVKVCFTGVKPTPKERSCMKKLGVSEVENVLEATHLVAGGSGVPLKRTPKLLAGIGRCRFVVDVEWLYQSAKEGRLLDGLEFVLCDEEAEQKWNFNMRTTLGRRPDSGLLAGICVHVDPAVAGTKGMGCPPMEEMKMVVTSAGGTWLRQLPKRGVPDPQSLLVISHPSALAAPGSDGIKSRATATAGRKSKAYLPEMLFLCILKQKMSWPADLVVGNGGGRAAAGASAEKKPAKRRRV